MKVTLPWSADTGSDRYDTWARVATLMGGNNRGSWFVPDVDDEVLVSFEGGDVRRPFVLGGLWTAAMRPRIDGWHGLISKRSCAHATSSDHARLQGGRKIDLKPGGGGKDHDEGRPGAVEIVDGKRHLDKLELAASTLPRR